MSEKFSVKAVIFDCDGVLVDSEHLHYEAWRWAIQKQGSDLSLEEYYLCVGKPTPEAGQWLTTRKGIDCDRLLEEKRAYYHERQVKGIPPIQPTVDLVRLLAKEKGRLGLRLGVASAAKKAGILCNLRHVGIEECFDVVLSGQDDLKEYHDPEGVNKPKPYIYLHAAKLLGVLPEQCMVIEDSRPGVTAGVTAGCITIAVPNAFTEKQDLSHANLKIHSFAGMSVDALFQLGKT